MDIRAALTDPLARQSAEAAAVMRALSHEGRLLVLCHLIEEDELPVGALAERVGLSQSALSQHLARLRDDGLVATRRDGQMIHYRVADPKVARLLTALHDIFCIDMPAIGAGETS